MFVPTPPGTMGKNQTDAIPGNFQRVSWTKDSIYVRWRVAEAHRPFVTGYQIRYQAIGSSIQQQIDINNPGTMEYDITQLHENTNYELCMGISTNLTSSLSTGESDVKWECIKATTATDSLSVALGSTFGAFLALGIIVLFVFLAKWQHNRKLKKQLQQVTPSGADSYDSMQQQDGEIEMSDVSLQVHDDTAKWDFSSQSSSQFSNFVNGVPKTNQQHLAHCDGDLADMQQHQHIKPSTSQAGATAAASSSAAKKLPRQISVTSSNPQPSTSTGISSVAASMQPSADAHSAIGLLKPPPPPGVITTATHKSAADQQHPPDVRPKDVRPKDVRPKDVRPKDVRPKDTRPRDVRPKDRPLLDLTNAYQNTQYGDPEEGNTGMRPNMSCNW